MSSTHTLITVAPTGAETAKSRCAGTAGHARGAGRGRCRLRGRGGRSHPRPHPRRRRPADARRGTVERHGGGPARGHLAGGAALDRGQRPRPSCRASGGARRRAGLVLVDLRHGQLRGGRLPQPVAVHGGALPAHPGPRGGAGVRALRPGAGPRAQPAARPRRAAVRRARPLRPGDGGAGRHAWHSRGARGGGAGAPHGGRAGPLPAWAVRPCPWRWQRCQPGVTCGSAWKTP